MKWANLEMDRKGRCTLGDDIQLLAIDNLYSYMGISQEDVVRIPFSELTSYDGEYVILPISFPMHGYYNGTRIGGYSDRIVPVFLGISTLTQHYCQEDVDYFKRFAPIGCRDQWTMEAMRKNGINAYLNGCLTIGFPKERSGEDGKKKVFCIDVPDTFIKYIPENVITNCEFVSHVVMSDECPNGTRQHAIDRFKQYVDEAKLIITTRMHGALPCIAAGIPVVLAKDVYSTRFPMIDKITHIYTADEFDRINWSPKSIDIEELKQKVLSASAERLFKVREEWEKLLDISEFYETKSDVDMYIDGVTNTIDYLKSRYSPLDYFEYCIWGITQSADLVVEKISNLFPNATLAAVIDRRVGTEFWGKVAQTKDWLRTNSALCLVCAPSAMTEARSYVKELGRGNIYYCWVDGHKR